MAQAPSGAEHRDQREQEKTGKQNLVVVELGKRQTPQQIRRLREGRGKLMKSIDDIVADLIEAGTIKSNVQPVVIVVRETAGFPSPMSMPMSMPKMPSFGFEDEDEDDDEDDEDDEDEDED